MLRIKRKREKVPLSMLEIINIYMIFSNYFFKRLFTLDKAIEFLSDQELN
jgi:hypothetical protein